MENKTKKRAQFFARLASIQSVADLPRWEQLRLVQDTKDANFLWVALFARGVGTVEKGSDIAKSWGSETIPLEWRAICEVHPPARDYINALLDGKTVDPGPLLKQLPTRWKLNKLRYEVEEVLHPTVLIKEPLLELTRIIRQSSFPFRRCPVCKKIFVPVKRQKFCSTACRDGKWRQEKKEVRREYMKRYMAQKRKKERNLSRGKRNPTPKSEEGLGESAA